MVFVMAGWLVPAMAMEDEGPEPPSLPRGFVDINCERRLLLLIFQARKPVL